MHLGGLLDSSKSYILSKINEEYLPKTVLIRANTSLENAIQILQNKGIEFPIIAKPDKGERGKCVERLENSTQLKDYLQAFGQDFVIQEFIPFENEIGVFYSRHPNEEKGTISSIVIKEFLTIEGDGKSTIEKLLSQNVRAKFRWGYLTKKYARRLQEVLPEGEKLKLEPIGNHNRGTKFCNGNHLINEKLIDVFEKIARPIEGYFYGRFDLKYKDLESLYEGKNIKIMELNGVNSEPAHIYDPDKMTLIKAYRDVFWHAKRANEIAIENHKRGVPYASILECIKAIQKHQNFWKKRLKGVFLPQSRL
ncbi:MAG: D-alanine--D-alanine ligase [Flammeovirgaceae bacterium]